MTRSLARPKISTAWLLFGACAFGFVLGLVLLVAHSRPAAALEIPKIDAPEVDGAGVVRDPVGTVTKVVPKVPLPEAADRKAETPGPAAETPPVNAPVPAVKLPPVELPKVELPKVDLNQVVPVTTNRPVLPAVQLPAIDLGGIDASASGGPVVQLPSIDLGSIDPGLGGALPTIDLPRADLGAVAGGRVDLPSLEIPTPALVPVVPPASVHLPPVDLGGAARRLQAPTDAPYPLNSGDPPALTSSSPPPADPAFGSRTVAAARDVRAGSLHARSTAPLSTPHDAAPVDAPSTPASPGPSSSPSDSGGPRAPTFLFTFAVLLATIALGHDLSRRIALQDHVPTSQFLTVLIERPG